MTAACISRDQVINRIREAGWVFSDQTKRVEIWKLKGKPDRIVIAKRDKFPLEFVRIILKQAGLKPNQTEDFIKAATKQ